MKRGVERILTTHAGSLPRPAELVSMLTERASGHPIDESAFAERVRSAVRRTVERQVEAGIDIVSDGEMGKPSFFGYAIERLTGFEVTGTASSLATGFVPRDVLDYTPTREGRSSRRSREVGPRRGCTPASRTAAPSTTRAWTG